MGPLAAAGGDASAGEGSASATSAASPFPPGASAASADWAELGTQPTRVGRASSDAARSFHLNFHAGTAYVLRCALPCHAEVLLGAS